MLPDVQEEGVHLGPTKQPEEHTDQPETVDGDSGPVSSAVSAPPQRAGHQCRERACRYITHYKLHAVAHVVCVLRLLSDD